MTRLRKIAKLSSMKNTIYSKIAIYRSHFLKTAGTLEELKQIVLNSQFINYTDATQYYQTDNIEGLDGIDKFPTFQIQGESINDSDQQILQQLLQSDQEVFDYLWTNNLQSLGNATKSSGEYKDTLFIQILSSDSFMVGLQYPTQQDTTQQEPKEERELISDYLTNSGLSNVVVLKGEGTFPGYYWCKAEYEGEEANLLVQKDNGQRRQVRIQLNPEKYSDWKKDGWEDYGEINLQTGQINMYFMPSTPTKKQQEKKQQEKQKSVSEERELLGEHLLNAGFPNAVVLTGEGTFPGYYWCKFDNQGKQANLLVEKEGGQYRQIQVQWDSSKYSDWKKDGWEYYGEINMQTGAIR